MASQRKCLTIECWQQGAVNILDSMIIHQWACRSKIFTKKRWIELNFMLHAFHLEVWNFQLFQEGEFWLQEFELSFLCISILPPFLYLFFFSRCRFLFCIPTFHSFFLQLKKTISSWAERPIVYFKAQHDSHCSQLVHFFYNNSDKFLSSKLIFRAR